MTLFGVYPINKPSKISRHCLVNPGFFRNFSGKFRAQEPIRELFQILFGEHLNFGSQPNTVEAA